MKNSDSGKLPGHCEKTVPRLRLNYIENPLHFRATVI